MGSPESEEQKPSAQTDEEDIPRMDYEAHQKTFEAFMGLTRQAIIAVVILLIALAVFLL